MGHTVREVLAIWMMSPWQALILGPGSPQLGWSPARVPWDTEGSFVRCASRVTEEKRRASARTVPVCSAPAMGTARPATLSQVFVTAETTRPGPTVRNAAMATMAIQPQAPPWIASPVRVLGAPAVLLSLRHRRWCAPTVLPGLPVEGVSSVMTATLETLWVATAP